MILSLKMGSLRIDKNGFFLPSSFSSSSHISEFSIPRTPIFCIAPRLRKTEKNLLGIAKTSNKGIICAVTKVDSEKGLVDDDFIEKEFKFRPAFDDYVRAMESFRTGGGENSTQNVDSSDDGGSKRTSLGRKIHDYMGRTHRKEKSHQFAGSDDPHCEVSRGRALLMERENDSKENTIPFRMDNGTKIARDSPIFGRMEAHLGLKSREIQLHRTSGGRKGDGSNEPYERVPQKVI